jgi:hypothetical protein
MIFVHIAVHNTATRGSDQALVTSSSSSLVIACKPCAGSTTAASNTKQSTRWGAPRGVGSSLDQHKLKNTTVLAHSTKPYQEHHCSSTAIATHQKSHPAKHYGGQVKHKTKPGASPGGEGQAGPGASPGGEGQAAAKPGGVGKTEASQHQQQTKLYTAPLLHNYRPKVEHLQAHHCWYMISAYVAIDWSLSLAKLCFAQTHHWEIRLKPQFTLHWHITKIKASQRSLCWAHAMFGMHLKHTSSASITKLVAVGT